MKTNEEQEDLSMQVFEKGDRLLVWVSRHERETLTVKSDNGGETIRCVRCDGKVVDVDPGKVIRRFAPL